MVLTEILRFEDIRFDPEQLDKIIVTSEFDFRKSINNCEAIYYSKGEISESSVSNYLGISVMERIIEVLSLIIKSQNIDQAIEKYLLLVRDGLNNLDFLTSIINLFQNHQDYDYILENHGDLLEKSVAILEKTHIAYHKCVQTIESNTQIVGYLFDLQD
jgi:DNA polymerase III gamma/tau subunit